MDVKMIRSPAVAYVMKALLIARKQGMEYLNASELYRLVKYDLSNITFIKNLRYLDGTPYVLTEKRGWGTKTLTYYAANLRYKKLYLSTVMFAEFCEEIGEIKDKEKE